MLAGNFGDEKQGGLPLGSTGASRAHAQLGHRAPLLERTVRTGSAIIAVAIIGPCGLKLSKISSGAFCQTTYRRRNVVERRDYRSGPLEERGRAGLVCGATEAAPERSLLNSDLSRMIRAGPSATPKRRLAASLL